MCKKMVLRLRGHENQTVKNWSSRSCDLLQVMLKATEEDVIPALQQAFKELGSHLNLDQAAFLVNLPEAKGRHPQF